MNNPLPIGSRILHIKSNGESSKGELIDTNNAAGEGWLQQDGTRVWRYKIRLFFEYTVNGDMVETWVSENDVKIDLEYYRDLKLNELFNP